MDTATSSPVQPTASADERRGNTRLTETLTLQRTPEQQRANKRAFIQQLKQEFFHDILRARSHSKHFRHTRALYISNRVRTLSLLLAVLIPAWIGIDALYLPSQDLQVIALMRIFTGAACLGLSRWSIDSHDLKTSRFKLALLMLIPSAFHTATHLYLSANGHHPLPAGYHFFPFLIISLGAIFPLTIYEGGFLASFIVGLYAATKLALGDLFELASLNDIWLLVLLAGIAGWAALTQLNMMMRLYRQAHRDSLTGLANRRSIMSFLEREVDFSRTIGAPLSVILMDLDKFKRINDNHGHAVGDQVLCSFAKLLLNQSRRVDLVGRYGGEEFLVILTATERDAALQIAERLRQGCQQLQVETENGATIQFSTSAGVTSLQPGESIEMMMKRVDDALYNAKGYGRNRVVVT